MRPSCIFEQSSRRLVLDARGPLRKWSLLGLDSVSSRENLRLSLKRLPTASPCLFEFRTLYVHLALRPRMKDLFSNKVWVDFSHLTQ